MKYEVLNESNELLSVLNEDGTTDIVLKEGIINGKGMEIHEAFDFIEESIKVYQMKKYGHLL